MPGQKRNPEQSEQPEQPEHELIEDDSVGDVRAALAVATRLADSSDAPVEAVDADPAELLDGMASLLTALVPLLGDDHWIWTPRLLEQLEQLDDVTREVLPTMAGALVAAAAGESPLSWRRRMQGDGDILELPSDEAVALSLLTGLVIALLDQTHGPGTVQHLVDAALTGG
jgi:hypothetical protein